MEYKFLQVEKKDSVWTVHIHRPEALNALNQGVLAELSFLFEEIEGAFPKCRALILTGSGEKAFVAGADIKEISGLTTNQAFEFAQKGQKIFRRIEKASVPVVAAVGGFALGGGFELALSCDWIVASENAQFGLPEVGLGIMPGFGGSVRLSRLVGTQRARQLTLSGEMIPAMKALEMGVALKVVPASQLLDEARITLKNVLLKAPIAVAAAKKSVMESYDVDVDQAMRIEALHFSDLFRTKDMKEGTQAFIEKRKPTFTGA